MKKILAIIAAVVGAYVFNTIFNIIILIIGINPTGALGFTALALNAFISIFVGYKIYKKFAKVKNTEI